MATQLKARRRCDTAGENRKFDVAEYLLLRDICDLDAEVRSAAVPGVYLRIFGVTHRNDPSLPRACWRRTVHEACQPPPAHEFDFDLVPPDSPQLRRLCDFIQRFPARTEFRGDLAF
ncbi:MAG: hypothetical protein ACLVEF_07880 [Bifidobacterium bifidum]